METRIEATQIVNEIRANVDAWYANKIDRSQFDATQRALWARATARYELNSAVLAILRGEEVEVSP